jgi:hypothetical protein
MCIRTEPKIIERIHPAIEIERLICQPPLYGLVINGSDRNLQRRKKNEDANYGDR